jgi:transcription elongation factor GreA
MAEEEKQVKKNILTIAGLTKLQDELDDLKTNKMKEISKKIGEAREQGDLSENAEYDAAKDEQRDIAARIEEIEKILKNVEVVDENEASTNKVSIGSRVRIHDMTYDEDLEFNIVGSQEADSLKGKISNESPVGAALMGQKKGKVVSVVMGEEVSKYKIVDISRSV